jgi:hypothetical protein
VVVGRICDHDVGPLEVHPQVVHADWLGRWIRCRPHRELPAESGLLALDTLFAGISYEVAR